MSNLQIAAFLATPAAGAPERTPPTPAPADAVDDRFDRALARAVQRDARDASTDRPQPDQRTAGTEDPSAAPADEGSADADADPVSSTDSSVAWALAQAPVSRRSDAPAVAVDGTGADEADGVEPDARRTTGKGPAIASTITPSAADDSAETQLVARPARRSTPTDDADLTAAGSGKTAARAEVVVATAVTTAVTAGQVKAPVKDRLLEDFEQRFERALGSAAAGARAESPLATAPAVAPLGATAATYTVAHASVAAPIGQSQFAAQFTEQFAQRVLLFAGSRVQSAAIAVTPADFGPITVSIDVRGTEATLAFSAAHPATRAAIEEALPRLREMFSHNGLQLANAWVGDETRRPPARAHRAPGGAVGPADAAGRAAPQAAATVAVQRPVRLIDIIV
jgi:flagellar hook-length control protein FliK